MRIARMQGEEDVSAICANYDAFFKGGGATRGNSLALNRKGAGQAHRRPPTPSEEAYYLVSDSQARIDELGKLGRINSWPHAPQGACGQGRRVGASLSTLN